LPGCASGLHFEATLIQIVGAQDSHLNDLSTKHPEKREAMIKLWKDYVKGNGVIMSNAAPFAKREH
jgi:hypothetical protein